MGTPDTQPEKDLQLQPESLQEIDSVVDEVTEKYDTNFGKDTVPRESSFTRKSWQILKLIQLQEDPPLCLAVTKEFLLFKKNEKDCGTFPPRTKGDSVKKLFFTFLRMKVNNDASKEELYREMHDIKTEVGEIVLEQNGNEWALAHRYINENFRNRGFAAALIKAAEEFVARYAQLHGTTQKIIVNAGQKSTLRFFTRKGYVPQSAEDEERLKRIFPTDQTTKDENLVECFAKIRGYERDGTLSTEWYEATSKDPYVFEKDTEIKSEQNAYRVKLEKVFVPQNIVEGVAQKASEVRAGLPEL